MEQKVIILNKGVLLDYPADALPDGYASSANHVRFIDGMAVKMKGYESYYSPFIAPDYINGLFAFNTDSGVYYILRGTANTMYEVHDGAGGFSALKEDYTGSFSDRWTFAPFGNTILFTNGKNALEKFAPPYTARAAVGGSPPQGSVVRVFQRHALVLGQTTYPRRVSWSDIDDYETWTAAADNEAGDIDLYESNTPIIGGDGLGDFFAVYTQNQIHILQYVGMPWVFARRIADWNIGLLNKNLLVNIGNVHFFATPRSGFYGFDGTSTFPISEGNWKYIYDTITSSTTNIHNSFAFSWRDKSEIWFCFPSTGYTYPNKVWIYNYRNGSWTYDTFDQVTAGMDTIPLSFPVMALADKKLYKLGITSNAAGSAYPGYVISPEYDFGDPEAYKMVTKIQPIIESAASAVTIAIQIRDLVSDYWDTAETHTFNPTTTVKLDCRTTARRFRFNIKSTDLNSQFSLYRLNVFYEKQGTR